MLPLAFLAVAGGLLFLVAGMTGSSLASVVQGHPDGANATTPTGAGATGSSGGSNAAPGPTGSGGVAHEIVTFFTPLVGKNAAAGIAGNASAESSYDPNAPGGGLFQTIGGRGVAQGSPVQAQLESAWAEIQARGEVGALRAAKSPEEAARIFQESFEKPASRTGSLAHREQAAREAYG